MGPGLLIAGAPPLRPFAPRNRQGLPGSWVNPPARSPCSSTPDEPERQAVTASRCCRRFCAHDAGLLHDKISGLDHTAPTLAVYASQPGSPQDHARLASGGWPAFAGQDCLPARVHVRRFPCLPSFPLSLLHFLLLQASLAHARPLLKPLPPSGRAGGDSIKRSRRGARRAHHARRAARRVTRRAPLQQRRGGGGWRDGRPPVVPSSRPACSAALQARRPAGRASKRRRRDDAAAPILARAAASWRPPFCRSRRAAGWTGPCHRSWRVLQTRARPGARRTQSTMAVRRDRCSRSWAVSSGRDARPPPEATAASGLAAGVLAAVPVSTPDDRPVWRAASSVAAAPWQKPSWSSWRSYTGAPGAASVLEPQSDGASPAARPVACTRARSRRSGMPGLPFQGLSLGS